MTLDLSTDATQAEPQGRQDCGAHRPARQPDPQRLRGGGVQGGGSARPPDPRLPRPAGQRELPRAGGEARPAVARREDLQTGEAAALT